jgi:hypothetical protein
MGIEFVNGIWLESVPEDEENMTHLLSKAFEKAAELPDNLQDQLAEELLEELEGESHWDGALANSQDKLDQMAEKAARQHREGKTKQMGFDEL